MMHRPQIRETRQPACSAHRVGRGRTGHHQAGRGQNALTVGALDRLAHDRHLFTDYDAALEHARLHVSRSLAGTS